MTELWLSSEDTGAYGRDLPSATDTDARPGLTRLLDALLPVLPPGVSQSLSVSAVYCYVCINVRVCFECNDHLCQEPHPSTGDAPTGHDQPTIYFGAIGSGGECAAASQCVQLLARAGAGGVG